MQHISNHLIKIISARNLTELETQVNQALVDLEAKKYDIDIIEAMPAEPGRYAVMIGYSKISNVPDAPSKTGQ